MKLATEENAVSSDNNLAIQLLARSLHDHATGGVYIDMRRKKGIDGCQDCHWGL